MVALSYGPAPWFSEHDPDLVGFGIGLILVYWGLALLMLGTHSVGVLFQMSHMLLGQTLAPRQFVFHQIFNTTGWHIWRHRSHISFMRQDRAQKLFNQGPFTVFILGAEKVSIPIGKASIFIL